MFKYISLRLSGEGNLSIVSYSKDLDRALVVEKRVQDDGSGKVRVFRINVVDETDVEISERVKRIEYCYTPIDRIYLG